MNFVISRKASFRGLSFASSGPFRFARTYSNRDSEDSVDFVPPTSAQKLNAQLSGSDLERVKQFQEKLMAKSRGETVDEEDMEIPFNDGDYDTLDPVTFVMRAIKYMHTNRLEDALAILEKTVRKFPKHPPALTALGHAYRLKGRMPDAQTMFDAALEVDSNCLDAIVGKANVLIAEKQNSDAMELLEKALTLNPDYALTHSTLGLLYSRMNDKENAIKHHKKAVLSKDLNDPQPFCILGELLAQEKEYEESLSYLNKALKLDQFFGSAHIALCIVYLEQGNFRMTEDHLNILRKIIGDETLMKQQQGHVPFRDKVSELLKYIFTRGKEAMDRGDWNRAYTISNLSLLLQPRHEDLLLFNALCLMKMGKFDESANQIRTVLSLYPQSFRACMLMYEVKNAQGDKAEAFKFLNMAQKADPEKWAANVKVNVEKRHKPNE